MKRMRIIFCMSLLAGYAAKCAHTELQTVVSSQIKQQDVTAQDDLLSFIPDDLDRFMQEVGITQHTEFKSYYQQFLQQLEAEQDNQKKAKQLQELRRKAMVSMQVKYPQWFENLSTYLKNSINGPQDKKNREKIRRFLYRYATYEQMMEAKVAEHIGFWAKTKLFARNIGTTIKGWFSFLRSKNKKIN